MRSENGFSLLEVTLAMVIVAFLAVGLLSTTFQTFKITTQDTAWAVSVRQAQDLGYWISQDTQSVREATFKAGAPSNGSQPFITLVWDDWEKDDEYQADYFWRIGTNGLYRIMRVYTKNGVERATTYIADNIVAGATALEPTVVSGSFQPHTVWTLTIETQAGLQDTPETVIREYAIDPRFNVPNQ